MKTLIINEKDGSAMVLVPGRAFPGKDGPIYGISPFYISIFCITIHQFKNYLIESGSRVDNDEWFQEPDDHPVKNLTINEVNNYCRWAGVRLPLEKEWELAASGYMHYKYPWGDQFERGLKVHGSHQYLHQYLEIPQEPKKPTKYRSATVMSSRIYSEIYGDEKGYDSYRAGQLKQLNPNYNQECRQYEINYAEYLRKIEEYEEIIEKAKEYETGYKTCPVHYYPHGVSQLGLFQMSGNVYETVNENPTAIKREDIREERVLKGGSQSLGSQSLISSKLMVEKKNIYENFDKKRLKSGFRIVKDCSNLK